MNSILNKMFPPLSAHADNPIDVIAMLVVFSARITQMMVVAVGIVLLAAIGVMANHHASVAFSAGAVIAGSVAVVVSRVLFKKHQIEQDIAFQESLPPFTSVMSLANVIVLLSNERTHSAEELSRNLEQLRNLIKDQSVVAHSRKELIDVADQVYRSMAVERAHKPKRESQPIYAAIHYHLLKAGDSVSDMPSPVEEDDTSLMGTGSR